MNDMQRYAIYCAPRPGVLADLAARWLGRDVQSGAAMAQADMPVLPAPLATVTAGARRYGFHGTIRAPFRPRSDISASEIATCVSALAARLAPVRCKGLRLENLQGFVALTPAGCEAALLEIGAVVVEQTEHLRSPMTADDRARRRPETLTPRQRALLDVWGYPFVMDEFRFHLTLTDQLAADHLPAVMHAASAHFAAIIDRPFAIEDLCLFGEDTGGKFHLIHRYALTG